MSSKTSNHQVEPDDTPVEDRPSSGKRFGRRRIVIGVGLIVAVVVLLAGLYASYVYAATPQNIRQPESAHYHFRMQVLVNGQAEDFSSREYQQGYPKDQCSALLTEQPIHFHDNKDQFVHIHWQGVTGGQVMKYYGWNEIGGMKNALGYKLDEPTKPIKVTTHGNYLPDRPEGSQIFIYTGDQNGYTQRSWDDFIQKDLEEFFGKSYDIKQEQQSLLRRLLLPQVSAHADPGDADGDGESSDSAPSEEELTRINTLVGNVVIFVQDQPPSDEQIKDRFNNLVPLGLSTCGG
jgi:hypothetical protein